MKRLISVIILTFATLPCFASSIEFDAGNDQIIDQVNLSHQINQKMGIYAYGQKTESWSEWYAGPTWSPTDNLTFFVGAGGETDSGKTRWGSSVFFSKGRISTSYLWENGGSGLWDKSEIDYQASQKFIVGITDRTTTHFEKALNGVILYSVNKTSQIKLCTGEAGGEVSWIVNF